MERKNLIFASFFLGVVIMLGVLVMALEPEEIDVCYDSVHDVCTEDIEDTCIDPLEWTTCADERVKNNSKRDPHNTCGIHCIAAYGEL